MEPPIANTIASIGYSMSSDPVCSKHVCDRRVCRCSEDPPDLREQLAATFDDYATQTEDYMVAEVWRKAAALTRGFVPR